MEPQRKTKRPSSQVKTDHEIAQRRRHTTEDYKEHGIWKIQCIHITQVCLEAVWLSK